MTMQNSAPQSRDSDLKDIVDTALEAGNFSVLSNALRAADLVDTLKGTGPFTLFAPTDEAFRKLRPAELGGLLKDRHRLAGMLRSLVVPGRVMARDIEEGDLTTVDGASLTVTSVSGHWAINDANLTRTNIESSNGVIHAIDAVVLPA
jgi:uncharacterized surface protein with fasciclin (FAS1) repeats